MTNENGSETIQCAKYKWRLRLRSGVYYADGRGHGHGKHSLGTKCRSKAIRNLVLLDQHMAEKDSPKNNIRLSTNSDLSEVPIRQGWDDYLAARSGSVHLGGLTESSRRRYRSHQSAIVDYCSEVGIGDWSNITKQLLQAYGRWLESSRKLAPRSIHNDLVMQVCVSNWLIGEGRIPASCKIVWKMKKPSGAEVYCFGKKEVRRMLEFTSEQPGIQWLNPVIMLLSHTGMRIGEAAQLRWTDVELKKGIIQVRDERFEKSVGPKRLVKDRESRRIPIQPQLRDFLSQLKLKGGRGHVLRGAGGGSLNYNYARERFVEKVIQPLSSEFPRPEHGVGFPDARFHSFRHFFVSECFANGCPEADIRDWLGHSSSQIVELYRHQRFDISRQRINQIDFGAILPQVPTPITEER